MDRSAAKSAAQSGKEMSSRSRSSGRQESTDTKKGGKWRAKSQDSSRSTSRSKLNIRVRQLRDAEDDQSGQSAEEEEEGSEAWATEDSSIDDTASLTDSLVSVGSERRSRAMARARQRLQRGSTPSRSSSQEASSRSVESRTRSKKEDIHKGSPQQEPPMKGGKKIKKSGSDVNTHDGEENTKTDDDRNPNSTKKDSGGITKSGKKIQQFGESAVAALTMQETSVLADFDAPRRSPRARNESWPSLDTSTPRAAGQLSVAKPVPEFSPLTLSESGTPVPRARQLSTDSARTSSPRARERLNVFEQFLIEQAPSSAASSECIGHSSSEQTGRSKSPPKKRANKPRMEQGPIPKDAVGNENSGGPSTSMKELRKPSKSPPRKRPYSRGVDVCADKDNAGQNAASDEMVQSSCVDSAEPDKPATPNMLQSAASKKPRGRKPKAKLKSMDTKNQESLGYSVGPPSWQISLGKGVKKGVTKHPDCDTSTKKGTLQDKPQTNLSSNTALKGNTETGLTLSESKGVASKKNKGKSQISKVKTLDAESKNQTYANCINAVASKTGRGRPKKVVDETSPAIGMKFDVNKKKVWRASLVKKGFQSKGMGQAVKRKYSSKVGDIKLITENPPNVTLLVKRKKGWKASLVKKSMNVASDGGKKRGRKPKTIANLTTVVCEGITAQDTDQKLEMGVKSNTVQNVIHNSSILVDLPMKPRRGRPPKRRDSNASSVSTSVSEASFAGSKSDHSEVSLNIVKRKPGRPRIKALTPVVSGQNTSDIASFLDLGTKDGTNNANMPPPKKRGRPFKIKRPHTMLSGKESTMDTSGKSSIANVSGAKMTTFSEGVDQEHLSDVQREAKGETKNGGTKSQSFKLKAVSSGRQSNPVKRPHKSFLKSNISTVQLAPKKKKVPTATLR